MQVTLIQNMKCLENLDVFRQHTLKWYSINKFQQGFDKIYVKTIHFAASAACSMQISFDSRFAEAIIFGINFTFCAVFDSKQENAKDLQIFIKMAERLYQKRLISKRHLFDIKNIKPQSIVIRMEVFINKINQSHSGPAQTEQQWLELIGLTLQQFWTIILVNKINHKILFELYEITAKCLSVNQQAEVKSYLQNLINQQLKEQQIWRVEDFRGQTLQDLKQTQESNISDSFSIFDQSQTEQSSIIQNEFQQLSFFSSIEKQIQDTLYGISNYYSMFKNQKNANLLHNLQIFINYINSNLFRNIDYQLYTFGSLRSAFALFNQYDIDLTYLSPNAQKNSRAIAVNHLFKIHQALKLSQVSWFKKSKVYCFQNLPMPYLKIEFNQAEFQSIFKIQNLTKVDITIGNKPAVINSQLLSHYGRIPQIHFFCILIKFWAKSRNIINFDKPMLGLSSYVIVLMCIYYLMETKQIDFIEAIQKDVQSMDIGTIVPNVKRLEMVSLYENFKGFLQFYGQTGQFQKQRKVIYLLAGKLPQDFVFNQAFVVNVCDFFDKTNPGRLIMDNKSEMFFQFQRATNLLKSKNIQRINQIFAPK